MSNALVLSSSLISGGSLNTNKLSLNLRFADDASLTARKGPTPVFTRASTGTCINEFGYVVSNAINSPRFEHDSVSPYSCKGLLIEEQRTNLTKVSNGYFASAFDWVSSSIDVSDAVYTGPDGSIESASLIEESTSLISLSRSIYQAAYFFTPVASKPYTMSIWVSIQTGSPAIQYVQLAFSTGGFGSSAYVNFDILNGVVGTIGSGITSSSIKSYRDGWYRISATSNSVASPTDSKFQLGIVAASGSTRNEAYVTNTSRTLLIYGAQTEAGAGATSYIPTSTSIVVRSVDVCTISSASFSSFYNQSEGTFVVGASREFNVGSNLGLLGINDGTSSEGFLVFFDESGPGVYCQSRPSSTQISPLLFNNGSLFRIGVSYNATQASRSNNAGTVSSQTVTNSVATLTNMQIGGMLGLTFPWNGCISDIAIYKKKVTDSMLQNVSKL